MMSAFIIHYWYEHPHKVIGTVNNKPDGSAFVRVQDPTVIELIDHDTNNIEHKIITNMYDKSIPVSQIKTPLLNGGGLYFKNKEIYYELDDVTVRTYQK